MFQCCFLNVEATPMKKTQLSFSTKYKSWNNINLSTLNQCNSFKYCQSCFNAVFSTLKQRRWKKLNFHFQPNIKVETTLIHRRWINVILSVLFQRCFINVETMSINILRLNFHFQQNINVETTMINVDNQRCFNVESMLMCLLGCLKISC